MNQVLVLSRKKNEVICIGDDVQVTVLEIRGDKVRLGITAPRDVDIHRHEVWTAIQDEATVEHVQESIEQTQL
jgi:carbon storage regulator